MGPPHQPFGLKPLAPADPYLYKGKNGCKLNQNNDSCFLRPSIISHFLHGFPANRRLVSGLTVTKTIHTYAQMALGWIGLSLITEAFLTCHFERSTSREGRCLRVVLRSSDLTEEGTCGLAFP